MTTLAASGPIAMLPDVPAGDAAVTIRGLVKRYPLRRGWLEMLKSPFGGRQVEVLRGVSCTIGQGEFFGLLGPNGAGKTTLFKTLSTLITPDEGTATVMGLDVVRDAAQVRPLVAPVIADERSLMWRISARDNLELYASLHDLRGKEKHARVEEILRVVELETTGNKMVGQFSSGMKQRLLIARALLSRPRVLLLDEPTRSLDPVSARRFRTFLREEISARQGCTVLLATHNAEEASDLCDRIAILDQGRIVAAGTPDELALQVMDERYRVSTLTPESPALEALVRRGFARDVRPVGSDGEGWSLLEIEVPGGAPAAADALAFLTREGVPVARFERIQPSLADLIERVVQLREGGDPDA